MGNTGCCGLGGERKSSPIDRENVRESDTDEKKLKSAAPQNKNGAASSTSKDSKNNIKRKNSVLEGVLPPGISSKDMLRYDDDDVSMVVDSSDDMMPPEGNRPPGLAKVRFLFSHTQKKSLSHNAK